MTAFIKHLLSKERHSTVFFFFFFCYLRRKLYSYLSSCRPPPLGIYNTKEIDPLIYDSELCLSSFSLSNYTTQYRSFTFIFGILTHSGCCMTLVLLESFATYYASLLGKSLSSKCQVHLAS